MTDSELEALIEQYRVGLDAEIVLLRRLEQTAATQEQSSAAGDLEELNRIADARDRLTSGLVSIEDELRQIRKQLSAERNQARRLPGYAEAAALHHEAIGLVTRILNTDKASLDSLALAERARQEAARALDQGEKTLSAYRKVVTQAPEATLVNRRG